MSPLLEQAMKTLTVRCNTTALHPTDEDMIKSYFKALHKNGELLDSTNLGEWAKNNNWEAQPIKLLSKWADAISTGRRVVIKHKAFVETEKQIISHLKNRLEESK